MIDETFLRDKTPRSPEEIVMDRVFDEEIQQAIGRIPEEYRTVVLLALMEEMSYKSIAATLTIPLGTVMSRLHRGRKMLQASLLDFATRKGILKRQARVPTDEDVTP